MPLSMIAAVVLIDAEPAQVGRLAEQLVEVPGVAEAYSVTGAHDLVAVVRVRQHEELADVVTQGIARLPGIRDTTTLVAFRAFRAEDWAWDLT
jgi:DNA-binding Lrp family transcriptional regulator